MGVLVFRRRSLSGWPRHFCGHEIRQRHASGLMPWIASGYAIRATSYVFERVCYAYGATRRVLLIQLCAVIATFALTPLAVITLGLKGAAMAVPACLCAATGRGHVLCAPGGSRNTVPKATSALSCTAFKHVEIRARPNQPVVVAEHRPHLIRKRKSGTVGIVSAQSTACPRFGTNRYGIVQVLSAAARGRLLMPLKFQSIHAP